MRLYLDKATLVWNGNAVSGQAALGEFFESLPSSEFSIQTLDCQPVHGLWKEANTIFPYRTGNPGPDHAAGGDGRTGEV